MAVRRERVILELEDKFTAGMARAAAATQLLDRELKGLSGDAVQSSKATRSIGKDVDDLGASARRTEKDIDRLSGRIRILADVAAILGPSLIPVGGVALAGVSGLASQLGFAAAGAGTAVLAFQGLGDTLKALNKAELEPTTDNLLAAKQALDGLSPAAADFAKKIVALKPGFEQMRDLAATGLFPGLSKGLDGLESAVPRVERIVTAISTELGAIAGDAGNSLGSERWAPFLDFLADEGPGALADFATAIGNTTHALAGLWMSTNPLNTDFSGWLVEATGDLDRWANKLGETQGFEDFLAYIDETGPKVAATLGALGNAAVQIVQAAAPLGGPVLEGIEAAADALAAIADSDLGSPIFAGIAALALFNRTMAITEALTKRTSANIGTIGARAKGLNAKQVGRTAIAGAGIAVAGSGVADKSGASNTLSLALTGAYFGMPGVAAGAAVGAVMDLVHANDDLDASLRNLIETSSNGNLGAFNDALAESQKRLDDLQNHTGFWDSIGDGLSSMGDRLLHPLDVNGSRRTDEIEGQQAWAKSIFAAGEAMEEAEGSARLLDAGLAINSASLKVATQSADDFAASLTEVDEVLGKRAARRNYKAALDDFYAGLKENGKTLDDNTEKGRANLQNLDQLGQSYVDYAKTIKDPIARNDFLKGARKGFIDAQVAAGKTRKEARRLANDLHLIDQLDPSVTITANISPAEAAVARLMSQLRNLHIRIPVTASTNATIGEAVANRADGGTVPKTGKPYADRHLYMVADGEEIVSNRRGQADRYRPLLKAINNAANGATVGHLPLGPIMNVGHQQNAVIRTAYGRDPETLRGYLKALDVKFPQTIKGWEKALKSSTKVLDKEVDKRQALLDQANDLRSGIRSGYRSDIFAQQDVGSAWLSDADRKKAGGGGIFSALSGDISNLSALQKATTQLKKKGLDGAALADLLSNASLDQVQAFANGSQADVLKYESLYNQREKALGSAGTTAVNAAFGKQLAVANAQVAEAKKFNKQLERANNYLEKNPKATAAELAKAMRGAAPKRGRT